MLFDWQAQCIPKTSRPLIEKHLQDRDPSPVAEAAPVTWRKGSPYRGLEVFDAEHAPVFAGRTRAIGEINEILKEPDAQQKIRSIGFEPLRKSQAEAADYFKSEVASWGRMVRAVGYAAD